jgi:hypothetical protein
VPPNLGSVQNESHGHAWFRSTFCTSFLHPRIAHQSFQATAAGQASKTESGMMKTR